MDSASERGGRIAFCELEQIVQAYALLSVVIALLGIAQSWSEFQRLFARAFPAR